MPHACLKGNGLNIHDSGLYAVRWYTYDQQHMLDEQCEETALVPIPTRPLPEAPIFAYAKRQTPEEWSLDMRQLQTEIRKQEIPQSRILACIWPDVYQEIPTERKFVLVITR